MNQTYFDASVRYLQDAELQHKTPTLFDWLEMQNALDAASVESLVDVELEMQAAMVGEQ